MNDYNNKILKYTVKLELAKFNKFLDSMILRANYDQITVLSKIELEIFNMEKRMFPKEVEKNE